VKIRRYLPSDQGAVVGLFREFMWELAPAALGAPFQSYIERAVREELSRIEEYYFGREGQGFWVADENRVVGMVGVEQHAHDAAELRRMAVESAHRRKGLGRTLLAHAEAFCRDAGYRTVVLSTSELQVAAMRLYASSGYRLVREEIAAATSHKAVGGLTRYYYEKALR
jgi:ribosomal protein S18 acetylase RimI-like enzyme